jgi:O-antigen ligase
MGLVRVSVISGSSLRRPDVAGARVSLRLAGVVAGAVLGYVLTVQVKVGIGLLLACCYVPLALTDVGAGLALWVAFSFLTGIPALDLAGKVSGLLVAAAWLGVFGHRRVAIRRVIAANRVAFTGLAAMLVWVTLSSAWASDPQATAKDLWHWYADGLIFLLIASTVNSRRVAQLTALAFIVGAVLSVAYGLAGGLSGSEAANPGPYGGRLGGAIGDPNFLAAGVVPAIVLLGALLASVREAPSLARGLLVTASLIGLGTLLLGVVATQSRGGIIACLVGFGLAIPAFPRQRHVVTCAVLAVIAVGVMVLLASPSALSRITSSLGNGSGRTDEWTVALRMVRSHPVTGVGDANFVVVARDYTRRPGVMTEARYLVDQPHEAHNTFLQFLAETGVVGFVLFITVCGACLRAGWRAARCFRALGDSAMEVLSRAVVVATVAMLTASTFISAQIDERLWILLALGPAMLALAARHARSAAASELDLR